MEIHHKNMASFKALLLLFTSIVLVNADELNNSTGINKKGFKNIKKRLETIEDVARVGGGVITPTTYPWVVSVIDKSNVYRGPAAIVNKYWVLAFSVIFEQPTIAEGQDVLVYSGLSTTANLGPGIVRRGSKIHTHPDRLNLKHALSLLKICPSFPGTSFATLPSASQIYNLGDPAKFINYVPELQQAEKPVGEKCECESITDYDMIQDICLKEDANKYNDVAEKGSLVVIGGVFAGVNKLGSSSSGEPYISIKYYLDWIADNTPVSPQSFCQTRMLYMTQ